MSHNSPDAKPFLRWILLALSVVGAVIYSGLTGDPLNPDSITALGSSIATAAFSFVASHGFYTWLHRG